MDRSELPQKHEQEDLLRSIVKADLILETDVDGLIGSGRHDWSSIAAPGAMASATGPSTPVGSPNLTGR